ERQQQRSRGRAAQQVAPADGCIVEFHLHTFRSDLFGVWVSGPSTSSGTQGELEGSSSPSDAARVAVLKDGVVVIAAGDVGGDVHRRSVAAFGDGARDAQRQQLRDEGGGDRRDRTGTDAGAHLERGVAVR